MGAAAEQTTRLFVHENPQHGYQRSSRDWVFIPWIAKRMVEAVRTRRDSVRPDI